jgi:hypothetical protein
MATDDASTKPIFKLQLRCLPMPTPFGCMGKPVNQSGYSDPFPITMTLIEVD